MSFHVSQTVEISNHRTRLIDIVDVQIFMLNEPVERILSFNVFEIMKKINYLTRAEDKNKNRFIIVVVRSLPLRPCARLPYSFGMFHDLAGTCIGCSCSIAAGPKINHGNKEYDTICKSDRLQ